MTDLGVPLQDVLLLGGTVAPGPDGTTVLWGASSGAPAHLNAVDPATGAAVARLDLPGAAGAWAVDATPDGSVYAGTYGDGRLYRWTRESGVTDLGRPLASENFIWTVAAGQGATVYGGTSPGGRLFAYDPATGVRDYGKLSPTHSYVRSVAYADGKIYAGTEDPAALFEVDAADGRGQAAAHAAGPGPDRQVGLRRQRRRGLRVRQVQRRAFPGPLHVWDIAAGPVDGRRSTRRTASTCPRPTSRAASTLSRRANWSATTRAPGPSPPPACPFTGRVANTRGIGWAELGLPDYPGKSLVGLLWRGADVPLQPADRSEVRSSRPASRASRSTSPPSRAALTIASTPAASSTAASPRSTRRPGSVAEFHTFSQSEAMTTHRRQALRRRLPRGPRLRLRSRAAVEQPRVLAQPRAGTRGQPRPALRPRRRQADQAARAGLGGPLPGGRHHARPRAARRCPGDLGSRHGHAQARRGAMSSRTRASCRSPTATVSSTAAPPSTAASRPPRRRSRRPSCSPGRSRRTGCCGSIVPAPGKPAIPALTFDDRGRLWGIAGGEVFGVNVAARKVVSRVTLSTGSGASGQLVFNPKDGLLYGAHAGTGGGHGQPEDRSEGRGAARTCAPPRGAQVR